MFETVQYEVRPIPDDPKLVEAATTKPGAWVYSIDWDYPDTQRVPPEAIRGGWEVNDRGMLTGRFAPNPDYRAIEHSDCTLKPYMHAGAKTNVDQWVVEIDPRGEVLFPAIPKELILGWWYVDKEGKITDLFRPNSKWKPE